MVKIHYPAASIIKDPTHPGHSLFHLLPSGKRYKRLRTRTNRLKNGTVVSTAASQRHGPRFDSLLGSLSVWSLHILPVSAGVAPVSSHSPKMCRLDELAMLDSPSMYPNSAGVWRLGDFLSNFIAV